MKAIQISFRFMLEEIYFVQKQLADAKDEAKEALQTRLDLLESISETMLSSFEELASLTKGEEPSVVRDDQGYLSNTQEPVFAQFCYSGGDLKKLIGNFKNLPQAKLVFLLATEKIDQLLGRNLKPELFLKGVNERTVAVIRALGSTNEPVRTKETFVKKTVPAATTNVGDAIKAAAGQPYPKTPPTTPTPPVEPTPEPATAVVEVESEVPAIVPENTEAVKGKGKTTKTKAVTTK